MVRMKKGIRWRGEMMIMGLEIGREEVGGKMVGFLQRNWGM